jgi:hypothetical protein
MLNEGRHPVTKAKRPAATRRLIRTRYVFEFFVRSPEGTSVINGYRRAARHFKLRTLEDPTTVGNDTCRLLIHKSGQKLGEAAKILDTAYSCDDETLIHGLIDVAETWLAGESGVHWFDHHWRYWNQEQDEGALEWLGWHRQIIECGERYRVRLRIIRKG